MEETQIAPPPRLGDGAPALTPYERYLLDFPDGMKGDLIAGEAIIDTSVTIPHERLFRFLLTLLNLYVRARGLGEVLGSRTTVRVDDENGFEPDVLFIHQDRLGIIGRKDVRGAVDLAVEIVSPTSGKRDRETKFEGYERLGVPEYWFVDLERRGAAFYRLTEGRYRAIPLRDGLFHSEVVPGFRLDPQALAQDPRPNEFDVLRGLLEPEAPA